MKLSIEAKVAAAVAAAFAALTVATIAQGNSSNQAGGANSYGTANNPGVSNYTTQEGFNSSLLERTNARRTDIDPFPNSDTVNAEHGNRTKILKPVKHHT